jgi:hypothetical protein
MGASHEPSASVVDPSQPILADSKLNSRIRDFSSGVLARIVGSPQYRE